MLTFSTKPKNDFWFLQMAGWGAFAVFQVAVRSFIFQDVWKSLVLTSVLEPAAFLLTLGMRGIYRHAGVKDAAPWRQAVMAIICSLVSATVLSFLWRYICLSLNWQLIFITNPSLRFIPLFYYLVILTAWSYLYFWLGAERRADEEYQRAIMAESETLRTELKFLRAQLDPHFLSNVLNGITAEIPERPKLAAAMARQLSGYLRYSLDHSEERRAPLEEEMQVVRSYLELSASRFEERLSYALDVCPTILNIAVPGCLLQPLVENAIKHGMQNDQQHLTVQVRAQKTPRGLRLAVKNNGSLPEDWRMQDNRSGIGIKNLRRRLELLYPGRHEFTLSNSDDHVLAQLELQGEPCCG